MPKAESFILTTDFATLKNDSLVPLSASINVPNAAVLPGNGYLQYSADITAGTVGAVTRVQMMSTRSAGLIQCSRTIHFTRTNASLQTYTVTAFVWRTSPTNVRCQVYIPNPYSFNINLSVAETVTFYLNTFIPPFA